MSDEEAANQYGEAVVQRRISHLSKDAQETVVATLKTGFLAGCAYKQSQLSEELAAYREALEFYAENDIYQYPDDWRYSKQGGPPELSDCQECSDVARRALSRFPRKDP